ncbi:hypothetical protein BV25DRAFT_1833573 [Artomyces pyxidatus]|uniref:Uncharacterized protein n=1 Tax=Artomyces pyxidatus TaxID=48021 RepID=A0ACB8SFB7_9AGAM|nr:hypothetical protein BV25DRAFT_1833573 [Artomyces pyxidatus]
MSNTPISKRSRTVSTSERSTPTSSKANKKAKGKAAPFTRALQSLYPALPAGFASPDVVAAIAKDVADNHTFCVLVQVAVARRSHATLKDAPIGKAEIAKIFREDFRMTPSSVLDVPALVAGYLFQVRWDEEPEISGLPQDPLLRIRADPAVGLCFYCAPPIRSSIPFVYRIPHLPPGISPDAVQEHLSSLPGIKEVAVIPPLGPVDFGSYTVEFLRDRTLEETEESGPNSHWRNCLARAWNMAPGRFYGFVVAGLFVELVTPTVCEVCGDRAHTSARCSILQRLMSPVMPLFALASTPLAPAEPAPVSKTPVASGSGLPKKKPSSQAQTKAKKEKKREKAASKKAAAAAAKAAQEKGPTEAGPSTKPSKGKGKAPAAPPPPEEPMEEDSEEEEEED